MNNKKRFFQVQLFLLITVGFCAVLFFLLLHNWRQSHQVQCQTSSCVQISKEINQHLNRNVSPCEDFAMYACGGQSNEGELFTNPLKTDDGAYYRTTMQFLLDHYEEHREQLSSIPLFVEAINFHKACNSPESRDRAQYHILKQLFQEVGGFPLLNSNWTADDFSYELSLIKLYRKLKRNFLFDIEIRVDEEGEKFVQVNKHHIHVRNSPEWIEAYKRFIRRCIEILIESDYLQQDEILNEQINQLVNFELKLKNVSFDIPLNVDLKLFNITTWEPYMDWANVIKGMINDTSDFLGEFHDIISIGRDSVRHLNRQLVDKKTFANFLCWQICKSFAKFSTMQLLQAYELFSEESNAPKIYNGGYVSKAANTENNSTDSSAQKLHYAKKLKTSSKRMHFELIYVNGTFHREERSGRLNELCSRWTMELFPGVFDRLFKDYFLVSGMQKFKGMLNKLAIILEQRLERSPWYDQHVHTLINKKAIQLSSALEREPQESYCYNQFETIDPIDFTVSVVQVQVFNHLNLLCTQAKKKEIINIRKMNRGDQWNFEIQNQNTLPPNTILDAPNFWIMAKFGSIIARHIIKQLQSEDVRYAMKPDLRLTFHDRINCYRRELSSQLPVEDLGLHDRERLIYKYVAQSEGFSLAYDMFSRLLTSGNRMRNVDRFDQLNLQQLFFISYANGYCHYITKHQYNSLFHHLINFSVYNSLHFSNVFACPSKPVSINNTVYQSKICSLF